MRCLGANLIEILERCSLINLHHRDHELGACGRRIRRLDGAEAVVEAEERGYDVILFRGAYMSNDIGNA